MGLGTDPGTLGGAEVRSYNGPAPRSRHHADRDDPLSPVGDATLQHAPDSRLDNHDGPSGAGDIGTCRDLGRLVGAKVITAGYLASFATAPGVISLLMFLTFAAMPTLVTLLRHGRFGAISSGPR